MATESRSLTDHQTADLLRRGMTLKVRPIDALLDRLGQPGGWSWLDKLMHEQFTNEQLTTIQTGGGDSRAAVQQVKELAKRRVAEAENEERSLAAMAVYCFAVASGLAHHGKLYSSRAIDEWSEFFADLAGAVGTPVWREMLLNAAEIAIRESMQRKHT